MFVCGGCSWAERGRGEGGEGDERGEGVGKSRSGEERNEPKE